MARSQRNAVQLFHRALALAPGELERFLAESCDGDDDLRAEVDELLRLDAALRERGTAGDWMARSVGSACRGVAEGADPPPERIARFRIVDVLGRGGMGVVYRAEQEHPQRQVALKVLNPVHSFAGSGRRFQREAEILGQLHHPGIAQVYEAGGDDEGLAWFAMELVEGLPLYAYARAHGLDVRARLELLLQAAAAVEHAHRRGIVHRDLKPANLLVTEEGRVKVLDFGIARVLEGGVSGASLVTSVGLVLGTIAYMSPEQGRGERDVDTRADVYSLGAIAYELLCGELPLPMRGRPVHECLALLETEDPVLLGKRDGGLAGNVEAIVAKALEKDRGRRYGGATELIADLERHLAGEPIAARPPTTAEQLRRFARRHRVLVTSAAAAFAALSIGLVGTVREARRANAEARRVTAESRAWRETADYLAGIFEGGRPGASRPDLTARELLDEAAERIRDDLHDAPDVRMRLLEVLATSYLALGSYDAAEPLIREALEMRREARDQTGQPLYRTLNVAAGVFSKRGDVETATSYYEQAIDAADRGSGEDAQMMRVQIRAGFATMLASVDPERAMSMVRAAEALLAQDSGSPTVRATILEARAQIEVHTGNSDRASQLLEELIALQPSAIGPASNLNSLAVLRENTGHGDDALELYDDALAVVDRWLGRETNLGARLMHNRASALARLGRSDEAIEWAEEAYRIRQLVTAEGHPDRGLSLHLLGVERVRQGATAEGLDMLLEARRIFTAWPFGQEEEAARTTFEVARALLFDGRHEEAAPFFAEALAGFRAHLASGYDHAPSGDANRDWLLAELLASYSANELSRGRPDTAEPLLREALELRRGLYPDGDWRIPSTQGLIGRCLALQGELEAARPLLEAAHEALVAELPPDHARVRISQEHLAELATLEAERDEAPR